MKRITTFQEPAPVELRDMQTMCSDNAVYACINYGQAYCPDEIADRSICIYGDIREVLMS